MSEVTYFNQYDPSYPDSPAAGYLEAVEISDILGQKLSQREITRVRHLILKGADSIQLAGMLSSLLNGEDFPRRLD